MSVEEIRKKIATPYVWRDFLMRVDPSSKTTDPIGDFVKSLGAEDVRIGALHIIFTMDGADHHIEMPDWVNGIISHIQRCGWRRISIQTCRILCAYQISIQSAKNLRRVK